MESLAPTQMRIGTRTDSSAPGFRKKSAGGAHSASRVNFTCEPDIACSPEKVCASPPASASSATVPIEWPIPTIGKQPLQYSSADARSRRILVSSSALDGIGEASMSKCGATTLHPRLATDVNSGRCRNGLPPRPTANSATRSGVCVASITVTLKASAPSCICCI